MVVGELKKILDELELRALWYGDIYKYVAGVSINNGKGQGKFWHETLLKKLESR